MNQLWAFNIPLLLSPNIRNNNSIRRIFCTRILVRKTISINLFIAYFCIVKYFLNISAIFLILLMLAPMTLGAMSSCCSDSQSCEHESSEEEPKDDCMSLCFCSCCSTAAFYLNDNKEKQTSYFFDNLDIHASFFYQSSLSLGALIDIWQPPKI